MLAKATWTAIVAAVVLGTGAIATASTRTILLAVAGAAALAMRVRTLALLMIVAVCSLGLIRRLTSGGRVDYDPLLLLPIALLALVIVKPRRTEEQQQSPQRAALVDFGLLSLIVLTLLAAVLIEPSLASVYSAALFASCFALMLACRHGRMPDVRMTLVRAAPPALLLMALYGIYQFRYLPEWDRSWMVASRVASIGLPIPGEVRVFGTMESPGPYAVVLGALVILVTHGLFFGSQQRRLLSIVALTAAVPAFFWSGVRAGIIGLAIVFLVTAIKTRRLGLLALVSVVGAGLWWFAKWALAQGTQANVFVADRYSVSSLGNDRSLLQRLTLLDEIGPGLRSGLGRGWGGPRVDSLFVDVLLAAGAVAGALCLIVSVTVALRAVSYDWTRPDAAFHLVAVFTLVFALAGNVFATTSGLLVALAWGWVLSSPPENQTLVPAAADEVQAKSPAPSGLRPAG